MTWGFPANLAPYSHPHEAMSAGFLEFGDTVGNDEFIHGKIPGFLMQGHFEIVGQELLEHLLMIELR